MNTTKNNHQLQLSSIETGSQVALSIIDQTNGIDCSEGISFSQSITLVVLTRSPHPSFHQINTASILAAHHSIQRSQTTYSCHLPAGRVLCCLVLRHQRRLPETTRGVERLSLVRWYLFEDARRDRFRLFSPQKRTYIWSNFLSEL
jgi:hypothetical protein